ncbi:phage tail protein [uncultured Ruegeria sp.]|uniref:phage tail protein n=1 Tax=uncultured Ruegeria sp. TaxID=259304 RepID=UPI00263815B2|nr:phage tail protein [uncultured Ruegeria sp.]
MSNYYPPVSFSFSVSIGGNSRGVDASFSEVSGLNSRMDTFAVREGGENRFVHQLPQTVKNTNISLKRGLMVASSALVKWCKDTLEGGMSNPIVTKTVIVSLLDQTQQPMLAWSLDRAWPVGWQVAQFNARENSVAIETIDLAYAQVRRKLIRTKAATGFLKP